jgi:phosphohistidine phosphatase SixA
MSWSAKYHASPKDGLRKLLESGIKNVEDREQHAAAVKYAMEILVSGAVGDNRQTFVIDLSGHANAKHKKTPGWGNDFINVRISQL